MAVSIQFGSAFDMADAKSELDLLLDDFFAFMAGSWGSPASRTATKLVFDAGGTRSFELLGTVPAAADVSDLPGTYPTGLKVTGLRFLDGGSVLLAITGLPMLDPATVTGLDATDLAGFLASAGATMQGSAGDDVLVLGGTAKGSLKGGAGNDTLTGNAGSDLLDGGGGNDTLDGGAGADSLIGGAGDDRYRVDNAGDKVTEAAAGGTADTVEASVTHTLSNNVENLVLAPGAGNINGAGNGLANSLTGNAGDNTLDGGASNDSMSGGGGDDRYLLDNAGDVIVENPGAGRDTAVVGYAAPAAGDKTLTVGAGIFANVENLVASGAGWVSLVGDGADNLLVGNAGANVLRGNGGNDTLDGGAGNDRMEGGAGDDTYVLSAAGDVVVDSNGSHDTVVVAFGSAYVLAEGSDIEDVVLAGKVARATGNSGDNRLTGNALANTLDGGAGDDTMNGGGGNDRYIVSDAGDVAAESLVGKAGGTDTVVASVSHTLGANIENLVLAPNAGALDGTGNELANRIDGNAAANTLAGGEGNDTLFGAAGDDRLLGEGGNDTLDGGAGNDRLDGGSGNDRLQGGAGDDTYVVDGADTVVEAANAGNDTVESSVTHTLGANVENLVLTSGAGAINGTGNTLANSLTGNESANTLSGGAGNDTLDGGGSADVLKGEAGNDVYIVDASDTVVEAAGGGTDTERADASATLADNVEILQLIGAGAINGTGNGLANRLFGNDAANTLDGAAGSDTLDGGGGDDMLVGGTGNDTLNGGAGGDTVLYSGNRAEYSIALSASGGYLITHLGGADGTDRVGSDVEHASFADASGLVLADIASILGTPTLIPALQAGADFRWNWPDPLGTGGQVIPYSFMTPATFPSYENPADHPNFATPDATLQAAIRQALSLYEELLNVDFVETPDSDSVYIRFGTDFQPANQGGYAGYPPLGGTGDVWYNNNPAGYFLTSGAPDPGSVPFSTILHEIGHALGLKHPFNYGPDDAPPFLPASQDSELNTVMSYNPAPKSELFGFAEDSSGGGVTYGIVGSLSASTPMRFDISTLQAIYGANTSTRSGDTLYTFDPAQPFLETLWDGGGHDTLDLSNFDRSNLVNLNPNTFSSIGLGELLGYYALDSAGADAYFSSPTATFDPADFQPFGEISGKLPDWFSFDATFQNFISKFVYDGSNNLTIADTVLIEDAIGGSAADTLVGNVVGNVLTGNGGDDTLAGGLGQDSLTGGIGADLFLFATAADSSNVDVVGDFVSGTDRIEFDRSFFGQLALNTLSASAFVSGAGVTAGADASDRIAYDTSTGNLYYDADGSGPGGAVQVAHLAGAPTLAASDISVIA